MSKESKEIKQRLLIKKTLNGIRKYIDGLEVKQEKYIEYAKTAKVKGITSQYSLALTGLKACMMQRQKAEEMYLNIEISDQMRDLTQMTGSFLSTMQTVSKEMIKTSKSFDFASVAKDFEKAMTKVQTNGEKLEVMLETSSVSYENMVSGSSNKEIDVLINNEVIDSQSKLDAEILSDLDKLDAELKKIQGS